MRDWQKRINWKALLQSYAHTRKHTATHTHASTHAHMHKIRYLPRVRHWSCWEQENIIYTISFLFSGVILWAFRLIVWTLEKYIIIMFLSKLKKIELRNAASETPIKNSCICISSTFICRIIKESYILILCKKNMYLTKFLGSLQQNDFLPISKD